MTCRNVVQRSLETTRHLRLPPAAQWPKPRTLNVSARSSPGPGLTQQNSRLFLPIVALTIPPVCHDWKTELECTQGSLPHILSISYNVLFSIRINQQLLQLFLSHLFYSEERDLSVNENNKILFCLNPLCSIFSNIQKLTRQASIPIVNHPLVIRKFTNVSIAGVQRLVGWLRSHDTLVNLLIIAIPINSKGCEFTYVETLCLLKKKCKVSFLKVLCWKVVSFPINL